MNRLGNVPHEREAAAMTPDRVEHLRSVTDRIIERVSRKYARGNAEHGGRLWRKPVLRLLLEEVDDMAVYASVVEAQHCEAIRLLGTAIAGRDWGAATQAFNVLTVGNADGALEVDSAEGERGR